MSDKVTNLTFLQGFTGGDDARLKKYIGMFMQSAPDLLTNMKAGLAEKNWDSLRTAAHTLKPQLTYVGIKSLETTIRTIEEYAREERNLDQLPGMVEEVDRTCQQAFGELNEYLN